jgi:hypothetical protein
MNTGLPTSGYHPQFGIAVDPGGDLYMVGAGVYKADVNLSGVAQSNSVTDRRMIQATLIPGHDLLEILIPAAGEGHANILVTDMLGHLLASMPDVALQAGINMERVSAATWPAGRYVVRVATSDLIGTVLVSLVR